MREKDKSPPGRPPRSDKPVRRLYLLSEAADKKLRTLAKRWGLPMGRVLEKLIENAPD